MSEYQYVHFIAVDRPLDDKQFAFMEKQSSRADLSRREFTNEYHFGDFHGDAGEMMRRGFDVHFHYANFGIRKLVFRLPHLPCDKKTFKAFEAEYGISWTKDKRGKAGLLTIQPDEDGGRFEYLDDAESILSRLVPLREMLLLGDLRPLYLAWLVCADDPSCSEPPVPAGLAELDDALTALVELYEIPMKLVNVAAMQSQPATKKPDRQAAAKKWINSKSKVELKEIVSQLVTDDATRVRADLLDDIRKSLPVTLKNSKPSRTLAQLNEMVESE